MIRTRTWTVEIVMGEHEDERFTRAEARLHTDAPTHLKGAGTARRNPFDLKAPEIGDQVAAARALSDLAHRLLDAAAGDIEQITHERARLTS
jgi:hypothetical protein